MEASSLCRSPDCIRAIDDDASDDEIRVSRIPTSLRCSYSSPLSTTSSSLINLSTRRLRGSSIGKKVSFCCCVRNEVALQTLFQGDATAQPRKEDANEMAEPEAESTYFEDRETGEEERVKEQRLHAIADVEVAVKRLSGASNGQRELFLTKPVHVHVLEDRITKARLDLSFLEQHSGCVETEIKMLQSEEHVKLNDQLRRAEVQFDDLLRAQDTYLTESFKLYHRELLNRESTLRLIFS